MVDRTLRSTSSAGVNSMEPSHDLESLFRTRTSITNRIDRLGDWIASVESLDEITIDDVDTRLSYLTNSFKEYSHVQSQIELLSTDPIQCDGHRAQLEDRCYSIISTYKKFLRSLTAPAAPPIVSQPQSEDGTTNVGNMFLTQSQVPGAPVQNTVALPDVKLPAITLPHFSGNSEEFLAFQELFKSMIDESNSLNDTTRFYYLKSVLRGPAAAVIQSIPATGQNYALAWSLLQERYLCTAATVQKLNSELLNLPSLSNENPVALRKLLDAVLRITRTLRALNTIQENGDSIFVTIVSSKLDFESKKAFRMSQVDSNHIPTLEELQSFLSKRLQVLESLQGSRREPSRQLATFQAAVRPQPRDRQPEPRRYDRVGVPQHDRQQSTPNSFIAPCSMCRSRTHRMPQCDRYKEMSLDDRMKYIKANVMCYNCLSNLHVLANCRSTHSCLHCQRRHHTTLHRFPPTDAREEPIPSTSQQAASTVSLFNQQSSTAQVMLGTANILVHDAHGAPHLTRCLLDSGSQTNIISKKLADQLQLEKIDSQLKISGIGNSKTNASQRVYTKIQSCHTNFSRNAEFLILPLITSFLPTAKIDSSSWRLPSHITLADDSYDTPAPIDVLIGAELFFTLLDGPTYPGNSQCPTLIKTRLGWIFSGRIPDVTNVHSVQCHLSLTEQIERFWKIDECVPASMLTAEELECETHFSNNVSRAPDGRYITRLPFKRDPTTLGHSRSQARRRWLSVETRLEKDGVLSDGYHAFMKEYLQLGHMTCIGPEREVSDQPGVYYLPHHPVIKEHSTSTKIRVVFDASMKTSNGTSLNSILMAGPTIQSELFEILLRFRKHTYVMTSDVAKMYRQVLIKQSDRSHQRIFWRESATRPLCVFELNTVTYGMTSAPFLATRSLKQLALDEGADYPRAQDAVLNDFYVDDLLTGHDSLQGALAMQEELIKLLFHGGFPLRKWASNHPDLLRNIPEEHRETLFTLKIASGDAVKTLGLTWIPQEDVFIYDATKISYKPATTKRQILSQIASLYDPLGLLGPIVSRAKFFMQELWINKYDWDATLPSSFTKRWKNFNHSLQELHEVKIPRFIACSLANHYEFHGFCDASQSGYGCAIYMRTKTLDSRFTASLLCAKSRVAPTKQITIPRLELSAALLLARLLNTVSRAMALSHIQSYCWTDSKIVLSWLASPPHHWKTFVANRVAEIQGFNTNWKYVPTESNPADMISRGISVSQLKESSSWWKGPEFLYKEELPTFSETSPTDQGDPPEKRKCKNIAMNVATVTSDIFVRSSALFNLVATIAWILRFVYNTKSPTAKLSGPLTLHERDAALSRLIHVSQSETFSDELKSLTTKGHVSRKSKLRQLTPFLDKEGTIRVGGRLKNSPLSENKKHPVILSAHHPFTALLINQIHIQCLHGGAQLVLATLRRKYWIINGKNAVRKILHKCVTCFKAQPVNQSPIMGQLPATRTTPNRPFFNTGVDFAGPFHLKPPTRSNIKLKCYIAVFICMSTKCIHLELVGSLTSESFLAALKRFVSRRGLCQSISSDNATNFVGARNSLKEIYHLLRKDKDIISTELAKSNIQWNFIPPLTPHWGGLWEAGVKSMKRHLRRVAGLAFLTFEEFSTVLCAVEACLNSRPLTPLSADPNDLDALTPGHFLTGAPLVALPELDQSEQHMSRITRWHRTQAITQHFWRRWSSEYITTLTPLAKWTEDSIPLAIDQLVLVKDDHLPPLQWKMGRIIATHPGKDNITRVVTIKTAAGTTTRNAGKNDVKHSCKIQEALVKLKSPDSADFNFKLSNETMEFNEETVVVCKKDIVNISSIQDNIQFSTTSAIVSEKIDWEKVTFGGMISNVVQMHENPYTYNHCDQRSNCNTHTRSYTGLKSYKCITCGKSFPKRGNLNRHIKIHSREDRFICSFCDKCFSRQVHLNRHAIIHTGKILYKCDICDKKYPCQTHLADHIRVHTGEKPCKCYLCDKTFSQRSYLRKHILTHTGEKPFKCDFCDKSFSQQAHLNKHTKRHTGDNPYKCNICDKGFSCRAHLNIHIRTHTGEKPYKCNFCDKEFSQRGCLNRHTRGHTNEQL